MMRLRTLLASTLLCFGLMAALAACDLTATQTSVGPSIGGPFHLIDQDGRAVSDRDLKGKPTAIFFGFTYCPEICPTTLTSMTQWLSALGSSADRLNVVFVSVDPGRDTPQVLKQYLSNFDHRIQGFTGTEAEIAAITKTYRVYYKKVPIDGGYTMDHSTAILLFDSKGNFIEPIGYGGPPGSGLDALRRLIKAD